MARDPGAQRAGAATGGGTGRHDRRIRGASRHTGIRRRAVQLRGRFAGDQGACVMERLADLSLVQAAEVVASGQATSLELLHACWANLDAVNPQVNAIIWQERGQAEAAAVAADEAVRKQQPLGPLHGVPMAHKDMYYQQGKLTPCGSALRKDFRPTVTATVIQRLAAAGAYPFGGLNMAEFAQNPTGP